MRKTGLDAAKKRTRSDRLIYFYDDAKQQHSADLVSDATGIPVFNLEQTRDGAVVRKICGTRNYELRSFRELAEEHFQKPTESFESLVAACAHWNIDAEVRNYEPRYLPAVLIEDQTFHKRRDALIDKLKEGGEETFARELEKLFDKQQAANFGVSFYLNSANTLIRELAHASLGDQLRVCLALYNISFMAAVPSLRDTERRQIYDSICTVFLSALERGEQSAIIASRSDDGDSGDEPKPQKKSGATTIFMITPFADKYKKLEQVVRSIFERPPYFFRVLLARDYTYDPSLLANVQTHISRADAFIAEITDLNPNVMLELGAVIIADRNKPVFSLRGSEAKGDPPADIKAELYIPYGSTEDTAQAIETDIRKALERDGRPSHFGIRSLLDQRQEKALTRTLLNHLGQKLAENEIDEILRVYETVEQFMRADKEEICRQTS